MGSIKAAFKLMASPIEPNKKGTIAPPTIAVHKIPEAWSVYLPKFFTANVKMVANINEFINPTANMLHMAIEPNEAIDIAINKMAARALNANTFPGLNFCKIMEPINRPNIAPPQ